LLGQEKVASLQPGYNDHTVTSTPEGVFVTVRARPLVGQEAGLEPEMGGFSAGNQACQWRIVSSFLLGIYPPLISHDYGKWMKMVR
jgi:hypothetical protein